MIFALDRLMKEHPEHERDLSLLLTVGEEVDSIGMKARFHSAAYILRKT